MQTSRLSFHEEIRRNKIYSGVLVVVVLCVLILLGYVIGLVMGPDWFLIIMVLAIIISISYTLVGYYKSDKIALKSVNAKLANREKHSQYYHLVEGITLASGLPMPKLYVMENPQINAFATGRDPRHGRLRYRR